MSEFIYQIIQFIYKLFANFISGVASFINNFTSESNLINVSINSLNEFYDKQILNGELLSVGLTWRELILYFLPLFLAILFIILMAKFVSKLISIVRLD